MKRKYIDIGGPNDQPSSKYRLCRHTYIPTSHRYTNKLTLRSRYEKLLMNHKYIRV